MASTISQTEENAMKKHILITSLLLAIVAPASAQWATIDTAAVAQLKAQIDQLKNQYKQMERTYEGMNGSRGINEILQRSENRKFLPQEWQQVYDQVQRGERGGLSGKINSIKNANAVLSADGVKGLTASTSESLDRNRTSLAVAQGTTEEAYRRSGERIDYLQTLTSKIAQSSDPKAIMDLQAGIAAEQAQIQNEQIRLQLASQLQQVDHRKALQREREELLEMTGPSRVRIR
jgi:type IV secretion system protein VirB5